MENNYPVSLKNILLDRKEKLHDAASYLPEPSKIVNLLLQVDAALERIDSGTYGICDVCLEPIEEDRLMVDPLVTVCLPHLSEAQQRALELDLESASKIQKGLLPKNNLTLNGWEFSYSYSPAGVVSGDFCDLTELTDGTIVFTLGDVSGKGISASLMMSHLQALINSLLTFELPIQEIASRANRLFCESTLSGNYATMTFGKTKPNGEVEFCVAGHNPPLLVQQGRIKPIKATGLPVGLFCNAEYDLTRFKMKPGDFILVYTDGLTESVVKDIEYGEARVKTMLLNKNEVSAKSILDNLLNDFKNYLGATQPSDDVTVAVLKKI